MVPARRQRKTGAELLSKKEAARRLGVDRATTLGQNSMTRLTRWGKDSPSDAVNL
jgi:hypothetical protein